MTLDGVFDNPGRSWWTRQPSGSDDELIRLVGGFHDGITWTLAIHDACNEFEFGRNAAMRRCLNYELTVGGETVFIGSDFSPAPHYAIDSLTTAAALLHFLALKPGDTDAEYFSDYTPLQRDFADLYGEELAQLADDIESREEEA